MNITKIKQGMKQIQTIKSVELVTLQLFIGFKSDRTSKTNLAVFRKYCPDGDVEAMKANGNIVNKQL